MTRLSNKFRVLLILTEITIIITISSKVITVIPVILEEKKDWLLWIEVIRIIAGDLWDFVNLSVPLVSLKTLEEPIEPIPVTVKAVTIPSSM